jgi:hypothetical protein
VISSTIIVASKNIVRIFGAWVKVDQCFKFVCVCVWLMFVD